MEKEKQNNLSENIKTEIDKEKAQCEITAAPAEAAKEAGNPEEPKRSFKEKCIDLGFTKKYFLVFLGIFIVSLIIYIVSRISSDFAEFFARGPASFIRMILAKLTGWLPFSLAEAIILLMPLFAAAYIITSSRAFKKDSSSREFSRRMLPLLCVLMMMFSLFSTAFAASYFRHPLEANLGFERKTVSADELAQTAEAINAELSEIVSDIDFAYGDSSYMPYSYNELCKKINAAFEIYASKNDYINHFTSNPKPIVLSGPLTYTQISGLYSFFTGEANINVNYPDYIRPFTIAHEMSHQRGIAREDEANFVAFLVCMESDDAYIKYSALLNVQEYVLNALYKADKDKYKEVYPGIPVQVRCEMVAFNKFFDKYKSKVVSTVAGTINDAFLQTQGQIHGSQSYGMVVDLAVAYYKNQK